MRMLQGEIHILYDLRLLRKNLDEFIAKIFRITVEYPNPCNLINLRQCLKQCGKHRFMIEIQTIVCTVLCDENNLPHATSRKVLHLRDNILHGAAAKISPNKRNCTKCTTMVTSFGNFYISRIAWCRTQPRGLSIINGIICTGDDKPPPLQRFLNNLHDAAPCTGSDDGICLRHLIQKLLPITLPKTSCYNEAAAASCLLIVRHSEHRCDGLLFRRLYKCTCIDNQDICLCRFIRQLDAVLLHNPEHDFSIHQILCTTETDETCFHLKNSSGTHLY